MNKNDFIYYLGRSLGSMPEEDKKEIVYDYEEHFRIGLESGRTEDDIAKSLGDPRTLAKQYLANYKVERAQSDASAGNILRAVFAVISLGFFNLVFVLGPFLGITGVLVGLFAAALGITVSGIAVIIAVPLAPVFPGVITVSPVLLGNSGGVIFLGIGLACLGVLFLIGVWYLAKYFYFLTIKYLKFNLKLITNKEV